MLDEVKEDCLIQWVIFGLIIPTYWGLLCEIPTKVKLGKDFKKVA